MNFDDLGWVELPVRIDGRDYVVREASASANRAYKNCIYRSSVVTADGKSRPGDGMADAEPLLVSLCLYQRLPNGKEAPVPLEIVLGWPDRVQDRLFDWVKEHSPSLTGDTPEGLRKTIAALQDKLAEMERGPSPAERAKN